MDLLPPRPTLFPYTTLFRSSDCLLQVTLFNGTKHQQIVCRVDSDTDECLFPASIGRSLGIDLEAVCLEFSTRSEEHTSELQSRRDLVCRLLLEKKKTIKS